MLFVCGKHLSCCCFNTLQTKCISFIPDAFVFLTSEEGAVKASGIQGGNSWTRGQTAMKLRIFLSQSDRRLLEAHYCHRCVEKIPKGQYLWANQRGMTRTSRHTTDEPPTPLKPAAGFTSISVWYLSPSRLSSPLTPSTIHLLWLLINTV